LEGRTDQLARNVPTAGLAVKANPTYAESLPPEVLEPLDLFTAAARASDPDTSHEAARSVRSQTMRLQYRRILQILRCSDLPLSDQQIVATYESLWGRCSDSGLRTRRKELTRAGFVCHAGDGKTEAGRRCHLHGLAPEPPA